MSANKGSYSAQSPKDADLELEQLEVTWNEVLTTALAAVSLEQEVAVQELATRARGIELAVSQTSAKDLRGLAVKLRLIKHGLTVGPTELDRVLCVSVLDDIDAMLRREAANTQLID